MRTLPPRFDDGTAVRSIRTDPATDCWIWQGELNRNGYGTLRIKGRRKMVHRIVYEALVGPIPPGLLLDHTCRRRSCCNPKHLEPVTPLVNTLRGEAKLFEKEN